MTALADFARNNAAPAKVDLPKDWRPTIELTGDRGRIVVPVSSQLEGDEDDKERKLLAHAGFNPAGWMIAGPIQYRSYMRDVRIDGQPIDVSDPASWMHYYKFDIVRLSNAASELRQLSADELMKFIRKPKAKTPKFESETDCWGGVLSDWQIGKGEGDGTPGTIQRVTDSIDLSVKRIKELRKIGRRMPQGALLGTGDLVEGVCGFYANQPYLIDLNDREQGRVVADLLTYALEEISPLFDDFLMATSLDNHGQKRNNDGKMTTDTSDNKTAECYDVVYRAFERDGRYSNIRWVIPNDETSILVELGGVPVGLTHGDLFYGGGKLAQAKALEWWKGQDFGMQPLRGAKILLSGHYHHYSCIQHGCRTHIQVPAMDPGSKWFRDSSGFDSPPGMFTARFDNALAYGWADEAILLAA